MKYAMDLSKISGGAATLQSLGATNLGNLVDAAANAPPPPPRAPAGPALSEEQMQGLVEQLMPHIKSRIPQVPSAEEVTRGAPSLPLSLSSKVGLGLLAATALPAVGYGVYRGYQHFNHPHEGEEGASADEVQKAASFRVTAQDLAAYGVPQPITARRAAWAEFGF